MHHQWALGGEFAKMLLHPTFDSLTPSPLANAPRVLCRRITRHYVLLICNIHRVWTESWAAVSFAATASNMKWGNHVIQTCTQHTVVAFEPSVLNLIVVCFQWPVYMFSNQRNLRFVVVKLLFVVFRIPSNWQHSQKTEICHRGIAFRDLSNTFALAQFSENWDCSLLNCVAWPFLNNLACS